VSKKSRGARSGSPQGAAVLSQTSQKGKWARQWGPPTGFSAYFDPRSDEDFRRAHPVGYGFLVALGIAALLLPCIAYSFFAFSRNPDGNAWLIPGWTGAFCIGIGLFNFVAILIRQYLGHLVSVASFLIGGILVAVSLHFL